MSGWTSKRFWKVAEVMETDAGFSVALDGRPVRTPLKKQMILPTAAFAHEVATEWDAQPEQIDPLSMPLTRAANAALDKVAAQRDEVRAMLAAYGETDLLCYRATGPPKLIARQAAIWDGHLDWAAERFGARLLVTSGIVPVSQPADSLSAYRAELDRFTDFELTGFHDLVAISGSLILALAVVEGRLAAAEAYDQSRIDELWQIEHWGEDDEATALAERKRSEFLRAKRVMDLSAAQ
jgi:chaperone required for assembly of F1-ATPase